MTITAREAQERLILGGWSPPEAYDALADAGYDPHPDAPDTVLTDRELQNIADCHQFRYADVLPLNGKRGPGRPRIGRRIDVVLPDDDIAWLDEKCQDLDVSRAEMIRRLIEWWRDKDL